MAVFSVPALARLLATSAGEAIYINGDLRHADMVVSCPTCHRIIQSQDIIDVAWSNELIEPFSIPQRQYVTGPVQVTIWHAGHQPGREAG